MTKKILYFKLAAEAALSSPICQRHGAVVVHKHRVVSCENNVKSFHAEHHALKKLRCKKVKQRVLRGEC